MSISGELEKETSEERETATLPETLSGIRVLDLGRVLSAPFCGAILAEFGAQVIKIENPMMGDETRDYSPKRKGESGYCVNFNRGKMGITLNLKKGKHLFLDMVRTTDVVIENFRPGVMKRLGLDYGELKKNNPGLIYAAISGFGQKGAYAPRAGYDTMAQAMGGMMSVTGQSNGLPTRVGASAADVMAGLHAVVAIFAALRHRDQTGKGQMIDIAFVDAAVVSMAEFIQEYFTSGAIYKPGEIRSGRSPFESLLETNDGHVVLCIITQKQWETLCGLMDRPDLIHEPRFSSDEMRVIHHKQLDRILESWTAMMKTSDLVDILIESDLPAAPVLNIAQVTANRHIRHRKMFVNIRQPLAGNIDITNTAIKMSGRGPSVKGPAPLLGEHNRQIYSQLLGFTENQISDLAQRAII